MTNICVHVACDRPQRARTLCEKHYTQLKRSGLPTLIRQPPRKATGVRLDAQLGQNRNCVDCGEPPWGGGMRCWDHFKARCGQNAGTEHLCTRHPAGASCYQICRCRCEECREGKRQYARRFR
jgi:hypothetical protein